MPFDSGTVQCVALNLQGPGGTTATPPAGSDGTGYTFVQQILGSSAPSLQGKNAAVFSLQLNQEGATILEQVFRQRGAPVSVIYNLEYTALSESLDVEIKADLKKIYDHLKVGLDVGAAFPIGGVPIYAQAGIDLAFEKLKQNGVIQIKVISSSTSQETKDQEKWALDFFKSTLIPEWFKPTLGAVQFPAGGTGLPIPGVGDLPGLGGVIHPPATGNGTTGSGTTGSGDHRQRHHGQRDHG